MTGRAATPPRGGAVPGGELRRLVAAAVPEEDAELRDVRESLGAATRGLEAAQRQQQQALSAAALALRQVERATAAVHDAHRRLQQAQRAHFGALQRWAARHGTPATEASASLAELAAARATRRAS